MLENTMKKIMFFLTTIIFVVFWVSCALTSIAFGVSFLLFVGGIGSLFFSPPSLEDLKKKLNAQGWTLYRDCTAIIFACPEKEKVFKIVKNEVESFCLGETKKGGIELIDEGIVCQFLEALQK
jgi:hypothetical protein